MDKNICKKVSVLALLIGLILSSTATVFAGMSNFSESKSYPGFKDVASSAWYYSDVNKAYKLELFNGYPDGNFLPSGNITLAEAIKVAAVVRAIYDGETALKNYTAGKWYENFVSYAKNKGIIGGSDFPDYGKAAKRNEVAYIFSRALPSSEYKAINRVTTLPDVTSSTKYSSNIFTLYTSGILRGDNDYGTFRPIDNIKRAEVAAIINRVALENSRIKFTLSVKNDTHSNGGTMIEAQATVLIAAKINSVPSDRWLGRELTIREQVILNNIKTDPKNSYPEFGTVQAFNYVKEGYDFEAVYSDLIATIIMCDGDINNYNDGQY